MIHETTFCCTGSRYQPPHFWAASVTMPLEAARGLSIADLFRVLNEKIGLECTRPRTAASLETEVSAYT